MAKKENISSINHVAIIMDGNGRWASSRFHSRQWGHVRGSRVVSKIVEEADKCKLQSLTLFAFSTENWSRPIIEVNSLFKLLKKYLLKEEAKIMANDIRFKVIGDIDHLPEDTKALINKLESSTKEAKGLKLNFAFGYGSRTEITRAVNKFIIENPGRELLENDISSNLFLSDVGDIDLLIRTGGEQRVSNFLLWQIAYAELFFTDTKWPDFTPTEFRSIINHISNRERRFGMASAGKNINLSLAAGAKNIDIIKNELRN